MSKRSVEDLLDEVMTSEIFAELLEQHLDAHPLPVDEGAVQRSAARLHRRLAVGLPGVRSWAWGGLLAAAALATVMARPVGVPGAVQEAPGEVVTLRVEAPPDDAARAEVQECAPAGREIRLTDDARIIAVELEQAAIVLVQEGGVEVDGERVEAGNWAIVGRSPEEDVRFRDGEAPPAVVVEDPVVDGALKQARFDALPPRTLRVLSEGLGSRGD